MALFLLLCIFLSITTIKGSNVDDRLLELDRKVEVLTNALEKCGGEDVGLSKRQGKQVGYPIREVAFSAAKTSDVTPVASNEIIVYDHVHINQGNAYDANVGGFKATVRGIYHFATTMMSTSSYYMEIEMVYTTGNYTSPLVLCRARASQSYNAMGACIANVRLDLGDDVWVRHYGTRGTHIRGSYFPTFSGHLIYAE